VKAVGRADPDLFAAIRIPITFDPPAACGEIEKFISEIFPEDVIPPAWEILGGRNGVAPSWTSLLDRSDNRLHLNVRRHIEMN